MDDVATPTIAYATPGPATGSGVAAGVWITLARLALIFLGGCFCIGIMISLDIGMYNGNNSSLSASSTSGVSTTIFVTMLYALAFTCFAGALYVMSLGIRKLLAIGRT